MGINLGITKQSCLQIESYSTWYNQCNWSEWFYFCCVYLPDYYKLKWYPKLPSFQFSTWPFRGCWFWSNFWHPSGRWSLQHFLDRRDRPEFSGWEPSAYHSRLCSSFIGFSSYQYRCQRGKITGSSDPIRWCGRQYHSALG